MPDWDSPKWRKEGRTGPGPIAPKYAKSKDRRAVRRGKDVGTWKGDSNPGGPGGRTRRIQTNKGGGGKPPKKDGCAMVALALVGGVSAAGWALVEAVKAVI